MEDVALVRLSKGEEKKEYSPHLEQMFCHFLQGLLSL